MNSYIRKAEGSMGSAKVVDFETHRADFFRAATRISMPRNVQKRGCQVEEKVDFDA